MPFFFLIFTRVFNRFGRYRVPVLVGLALLIVFMGALAFSLSQGVSYGQSLYWSITTATTVGYGDVTPHNTAGRVIATVVMLTTIPLVGAVFALVAGASALAHIRRIFRMDTRLPEVPFTVVYGTHPVVPRVLGELRRAGDPVVLVAPSLPPAAPSDVQLIADDPAENGTVAKSEPGRASRALIACTDDSDTLVVAVALHSLAPGLEVFALTQAPHVARALAELGVTYTLAGDELLGHTIAKSLETPQAGELLLQLVDSENFSLRQHPVDDSLVARPLSEARAKSGTLVLGIARNGHVDLGVGDDPVLSTGDQLIELRPMSEAAG
jgi:voltage-gated potassium channel